MAVSKLRADLLAALTAFVPPPAPPLAAAGWPALLAEAWGPRGPPPAVAEAVRALVAAALAAWPRECAVRPGEIELTQRASGRAPWADCGTFGAGVLGALVWLWSGARPASPAGEWWLPELCRRPVEEWPLPPPLSAAPGWDPASPLAGLAAAAAGALEGASPFGGYPDDEAMGRCADWGAFTEPYSALLRGAARGVPLAAAALVGMLVREEQHPAFNYCVPSTDLPRVGVHVVGVDPAGRRRVVAPAQRGGPPFLGGAKRDWLRNLPLLHVPEFFARAQEELKPDDPLAKGAFVALHTLMLTGHEAAGRELAGEVMAEVDLAVWLNALLVLFPPEPAPLLGAADPRLCETLGRWEEALNSTSDGLSEAVGRGPLCEAGTVGAVAAAARRGLAGLLSEEEAAAAFARVREAAAGEAWVAFAGARGLEDAAELVETAFLEQRCARLSGEPLDAGERAACERALAAFARCREPETEEEEEEWAKSAMTDGEQFAAAAAAAAGVLALAAASRKRAFLSWALPLLCL